MIVLLTGGADSATLLHVVNARAPVVPAFVAGGVPESPGFYLHDAQGSAEGS